VVVTDAIRLADECSSLNVACVALWLAHPDDVQLDAVRHALAAHVARMRRMVELYMRRDEHETPNAALTVLADTMSKARRPLLRRGARQSLDERRRGMEFFLRLAMDANPDGDDARHAERLLGTDKGRRAIGGFPAWLTGPAQALLEAAPVISLTALEDIAGSATDEELLRARETFLLWSRVAPHIVRFITAASRDPDALGLAGIAALGNVDASPLMVAAFVSLCRAFPESLEAVTAALSSADVNMASTVQVLRGPSGERLNDADGALSPRERVALRELAAHYVTPRRSADPAPRRGGTTGSTASLERGVAPLPRITGGVSGASPA
jgi:hypothetical protein